MRYFEIINEIHHQLRIEKEPTEPFKTEDTITVYHGFRDIEDAVLIAKYGTSGAKRANRVYSYEFDNNPYGIFVSPYLNTAKDFGSVVFEFDAKMSELEPPVWPGGTWTGQGGLSQYWGHGREGKAKRSTAQKLLRQKYREEENPEWIRNSDDPLLANTLGGIGEPQALFVGHLNPNRIKKVHLRDYDRKTNSYTSDWYSISAKEFLEKKSSDEYEKSEKIHDVRSKAFEPDEKFNGETFVKRMSEKYNGKINVEHSLGNMWKVYVLNSKTNRGQMFKQHFNMYLWPKQMPDAFNWFKKKYGTKKEEN